jgi:hypothetical protein
MILRIRKTYSNPALLQTQQGVGINPPQFNQKLNAKPPSGKDTTNLTQGREGAKTQPKELDLGVEQHLTFAEIFSRMIDSQV